MVFVLHPYPFSYPRIKWSDSTFIVGIEWHIQKRRECKRVGGKRERDPLYSWLILWCFTRKRAGNANISLLFSGCCINFSPPHLVSSFHLWSFLFSGVFASFLTPSVPSLLPNIISISCLVCCLCISMFLVTQEYIDMCLAGEEMKWTTTKWATTVTA